jgi:hypothetical protein
MSERRGGALDILGNVAQARAYHRTLMVESGFHRGIMRTDASMGPGSIPDTCETMPPHSPPPLPTCLPPCLPPLPSARVRVGGLRSAYGTCDSRRLLPRSTWRRQSFEPSSTMSSTAGNAVDPLGMPDSVRGTSEKSRRVQELKLQLKEERKGRKTMEAELARLKEQMAVGDTLRLSVRVAPSSYRGWCMASGPGYLIRPNVIQGPAE